MFFENERGSLIPISNLSVFNKVTISTDLTSWSSILCENERKNPNKQTNKQKTSTTLITTALHFRRSQSNADVMKPKQVSFLFYL